MNKSIVYSFILLSLFACSFISLPEAHSQISSIKATNYTWYIDSSGFLDVVGEIENVGTSTFASVILTAQMTTTTGAHQTTQAMAFVNDMLPNQKAPFYMTFVLQADQTTGVVPSVANMEVSVAQAPTTTSYQYQDVKVISQQNSIDTTTDNKGVYWVTGTVQNKGTQTATGVRVLGTFYDSTGKVIAYGGYDGADPLSKSLAPSAEADFKFGAYDYNQSVVPSGQRIASYVILVQVAGPILSGTAPLITPSPTISSTPSPSGSTSPTATAQPSQTPSNQTQTNTAVPSWLIPAIIVIVIVAVIVATILALKRHKPSQTGKPATKKKK